MCGAKANTNPRVSPANRKKIAAALLFVLSAVAALVIQDLYGKTKATLESTPFVTVVAPDDECPYGHWLFPEGFDLKTLPSFDKLDSNWAYKHGGYTDSQSAIMLTFQGIGESAVILQGMRIKVIERKRPLKGIVVSKCPIRLKPGIDVRRFETDLDNPEPFIVPIASGRDELDNVGFRGFPYKISQSEPEIFYLRASTTNCSCSWIAELDWTASGKSGTTTIDIKSMPFRTTARTDAEVLNYRQDGTLE